MLNFSNTNDFDSELFPNLTRYISTLEDTLEDEALELGVLFEAELNNIFSEAPPRGNEKFIWSADPKKNRKAQGWWFWQLSLGNIPTDGNHYLRQGKPPYGGKVLVERMDSRIVIVFTNKWEKSNLVFGDIVGDGQALIGHRQTGWQPAKPKLQAARKTFLEALFNRVIARRSEGL